MPEHRRIFQPPSPEVVPLEPHEIRDALQELRDAVGAAADVAAATYWQSKLIQPDWRRIPFDGSKGEIVVNDAWSGPWTPQSILVVNPFAFPVYVSANGDPISAGVAFPPQTALRLPIAGQAGSLVVAVASTDIGTDTGTVHLFRYATVD